MIKALYIHIPYCARKCRYCDFLSFGGEDGAHMTRYIDHLCREITLAAQNYDLAPDTVYIGGGTPSILPKEALAALLKTIDREILAKRSVREYTFEANPESLDADKIALLARYGVNRVSLGVQSTDEYYLRLLGRGHTMAQVRQALHSLHLNGLENINLDLMYALPGQSLAHWQKTLAEAAALEPAHLSAYQLTIEESTYFAKLQKEGKLAETNDDTAAEMLAYSCEYLPAQGYERYELSNYAQEGFAARHNRHYWQLDDYLGLGLGAVSLVNGVHLQRVREITRYYQALEHGTLPVGEQEILTPTEQMAEYILMNLRLAEGVELERFQKRFQCALGDIYPEAIAKTVGLGLAEADESHFRLTERGKFLANEVMMEFLD